jgi:hypothetical protein
VSWGAYRHKNAPDGAKLRWMSKIRPSESESEIESEEVDNTDLDEFEGLLSSNVFNLKKHAGDWDDYHKYHADRDWMDRVYNSKMAESSLTSPFTLAKILMQFRYDGTSGLAARNPKTPSDALAKFVRNYDRGNNSSGKWAIAQAARNPNLPSEILGEMLLEGWDDAISQQAASNPNTPPEALGKVLESKVDTDYAWYVAQNPNTPSEALGELLVSFSYLSEDYVTDRIALSALDNPNMPAKALDEFLRRGENDLVHDKAARHSNTPPETLSWILNRGFRDGISEEAAKNPNAPIRDRIKWLKLFGLISDEETEETEEIDNTDLDEFEGLLSSNKFNLKKHSEDIRTWFNEETASDPNTDPYVMFEILKKSKQRGEFDIMGKLLENPNLPTYVLSYFLVTWEWNLGPLNKRAVEHPNVDREVIEKIMEKDTWLGIYALRSPVFSTEEIREKWEEIYNKPEPKDFQSIKKAKWSDNQSLESMIFNPNFPTDLLISAVQDDNIKVELFEAICGDERIPDEIIINVFKKAANRGDRRARILVHSPRIPEPLFDEYLSNGLDDNLSHGIIRNKRGTDRARLLWMRDTGQLGDDESGSDTSPDNTDLDEFESLLSQNTFNLKKYANGILGEYPWELIHDPDAPQEILKKLMEADIGKRSYVAVKHPNFPPEALYSATKKNDIMAYYATQHPNFPPDQLAQILREDENSTATESAAQHPQCPPEALLEVINRGDNSFTAKYAISNPNCPPEALRNAILNREFDAISRNAVENPRTPPEALEELLGRGRHDELSIRAIKNPSTPARAKIKWMEAVGRIRSTKDIEETENIDNTDLDEFEGLLSSNTFNLKRYASELPTFQEIKNNDNLSPDILLKVVVERLDKPLSGTALYHPNCPPEAYVYMLKNAASLTYVRNASKSPKLPASFLIEVFNDPTVLKIANANYKVETAEILSNLATNKNLPQDYIRENFDRLKDDHFGYINLGLLANENTPIEMVMSSYNEAKAKLDNPDTYDWKDVRILGNIMKNPSLPSDILVKSLWSGEEYISTLAAGNKSLPKEEFVKIFSRSNIDQITVAAIENPNAPIDVLQDVVMKGDGELQDRIISWYKCHPDVLAAKLSLGHNNHTSFTAFHHPNARPRDKMLWLSKTQEEDVDDTEEEDNTDLDEFEGLLSGSNDLVKTANERGMDYLREYAYKRGVVQDDNAHPRDLGRLLWDKSNKIAGLAAIHPNTSPEYLAKYLEDGRKGQILQAVAQNASTPPEALTKAYNSELKQILEWHIITNYNCPTDILGEALKSPNSDVVRTVAQHPKLPLPDLEKHLLHNAHIMGQQEIAQRHNLSPELIHKAIKKRPYDSITNILLQHPKMSMETLEDILFDRTQEWAGQYKMGVANNSKLTSDMIHTAVVQAEDKNLSKFIMRNETSYVHRLLRHDLVNPETLVYVLNGEYSDAIKQFASRHNRTPIKERLKWIAQMSGDQPPETVEELDNTDLDEFEGLLSENTVEIRKHSADRSWLWKVMDENVSPEFLRKVIMEETPVKWSDGGINQDVIFEAVHHSNCPPEALQYILERVQGGRTACIAALHKNAPSQALVRVISAAPRSPVGIRAASNPNMPPEVLSHLLNGKIAELRLQAAKNPSTPAEDLVAFLKRNGDGVISRTVAENPSVPPRAKLNWLIGTGRLQNEKPVEEGNPDFSSNIDTDYANDDLDEFEGLFT